MEKQNQGYASKEYIQSLAEFGKPRLLPRSGGWVLERAVIGTSWCDLMGSYPLFCCHDWSSLHADIDDLGSKFVSLSLVADPFGQYDHALLRETFDLVVSFKEHFVADLNRPIEEFTSARHRKYGRRVLRQFIVEICPDPVAQLDTWVELYSHLIERHHICGLRRFSKDAFAKQLAVPGMVMFRATDGKQTLGLDLWYIQSDVAQGHLVGTSPLGYELQVSYGLKLFILQYFAGKVRWLNLGGGAGAGGVARDGLTDFKRGWASETRPVYFCGKILNRAAYDELVHAVGAEQASYFPAYRNGEFV